MSSLFNVFNISGSAMSAQSQRLNAVASNLANVDSTTSANGQPYKSKQVVFSTVPMGSMDASGVKVAKVIEDNSPPKMVYDPKSPIANADGFVAMPNVNLTEEMVNMIVGQRAYEANSKTIQTVDQMLQLVAGLKR